MAIEHADRLDWSWLRDFGVVAEVGSLSEAARRLGVSQPTLTRRMAALEERLGAEVLRRGPRGIELTETGEAILQPIRQMREAAGQVDVTATGRDAALSGVVRVSATEGFANYWCTPVLLDFQRAHPAIRIEVDVRNRNANLLRREADVALRLGRPRQQELVARRLGEVGLGLYASTEYLERFGQPSSPEALAEHACVGFDESIVNTEAGRWVESLAGPSRPVFRSTSLLTQLQAICCGWGIGMSAVFIADRHPELERVLHGVERALEAWLVTHPGLRRSARIRAVFDYIAERFAADREWIAGRVRRPGIARSIRSSRSLD
jgi:DNA-binding transcriptional LysR family regulator